MTSESLRASLAGRYEIERELGTGGMATVYLARDLRHDRRVAIKVLRPELAAVIGAERFLREIRTIATLQHPHILGLIDSGEVNGTAWYVMPFVEGESLRDRLDREKQLPIADAVRIATEVAGALDYAHRHGVIHRDIKPANILLHDGAALVADFGIALAMSEAGGTRMTETGMSLGTPHYMSPEQAMGEREITARSDTYALGVVTYEMLLGEPPFTGPTAQAIVAKMMTEKPAPLIPRRDRIPPEVEDAVLTALEKLPADRWASAREFAEALGGGGPATRQRTGATAATRSRPRAARAPLLVALGWAAVATAGAAWLALAAWRRPAPPVARYQVRLPGLRTGSLRYQGTSFALSPDGSRIAYVADAPEGTTRLYVRERDELLARALNGTDGADSPVFSPDGRWVGYLAGHRLYKVPVDGGAPIPLVDSASGTLPSAAWSEGGRIAYTTLRFGINLVSSDGGNSRPVIGGGFFAFPAALPREDVVLATNCTNNCALMRLIAVKLRTGVVDTLRSGIARAWFLPPDLLIAVRQDGSVVGAHFDPASLRLSRTEVPLLTGVQLDLGVTPQFALAGDGTALYQAADSAGGNVTVVRVDRQGHATVLDPAWRANINTMALSPDGRRLAVSIASGSRTDIWVKQLDAGPLTRLTFTGSLNYRPSWLRDGRSLMFSSDRDGSSWLFRLRADGSGEPERVLPGDTAQVDESLVSPDGQWLIYRAGVTDGVRDIFARRLSGDTARVSLAASRFDEYMPTLSPDGRWLAYVSVESGQEEVYVRPFPHADRARFQISTQGGAQPLWSPDGRQLYYMSRDDSLIAVEVSGTPDFHTGAGRTLFSTRGFAVQPFHQSYAVTPDGRGFIMFQPARPPANATRDVVVILNWAQEVRRKMAAARGD